MDSIDFDTHEYFRNFPPLYTEQVNSLTLTKQLEIWQKIINEEVRNNRNLYKLGMESVDFHPFKNEKIFRKVNSSFLALILEYLAQRQYAYYIHPINHFCKKNNVTVWGALFVKKNFRGANLSQIQEDYTRSLSPRNTEREENEVEMLKRRRENLMKTSYIFGIFPYPIAEMLDSVLKCIKSQCSTKEIETVYYIFYSKRGSNSDFNDLPEEHLAFLLSILNENKKIVLSFNDTVPLHLLNNKNVGIQVL